jgi:hypothetical protein
MLTMEEQQRTGDYSHLSDRDDYSRYFNLIMVVLSRLMSYANKDSEHESFVEQVKPFVHRLMCSMRVLRMRHLFNPEHSLALDLNESGFPHYVGIFDFRSDLQMRDQMLAEMPSLDRLKDQLITDIGAATATATICHIFIIWLLKSILLMRIFKKNQSFLLIS